MTPRRRLQEPSFWILTALATGPQHGYSILKDVETASAGSVVLGVGTLYGALDRLTREGLAEIDHEEVVDSRLRRYYRLSNSGAQVLAVEATRRQQQAGTALRRLGAVGGTA